MTCEFEKLNKVGLYYNKNRWVLALPKKERL